MPKVKMQCAGCGKEFEPTKRQRVMTEHGTAKNLFCSGDCYDMFDRGRASEIKLQLFREKMAAKNFRRLMAQIPETKYDTRHRESQIPKNKRACYLKEAHAILSGTKTRINRCQKLAGDD